MYLLLTQLLMSQSVLFLLCHLTVWRLLKLPILVHRGLVLSEQTRKTRLILLLVDVTHHEAPIFTFTE